jgi:drug/metabolite transporter (DMT)-like permease
MAFRRGMSQQEVSMKWAGMYLVGFIILIGGVLAALWKLGILANIGTTWTAIGVVILIGLGVMISVSNSGTKENIQIDRK